MRQKWSPDFGRFCLVPFPFKNCEPFAPKPENAQKCEPFANLRQKCEPFRIFGKTEPKTANPLRKRDPKCELFANSCQKCEPFQYIKLMY